ncbi:hypothetical protein [uncultured Ruminococcus sp.]|nr:hypothetical protein [uncultured Ruminococcus sp.]
MDITKLCKTLYCVELSPKPSSIPNAPQAISVPPVTVAVPL